MSLILLKIFFCIVAFLLGVFLSIRMIFSSKFENNNKLSPFVAMIGGLFLFYTLIGLFLGIIYPGLLKKLMILTFAISPFIIGRLVSYKSLKIYTTIQIICVILSIGFVLIF